MTVHVGTSGYYYSEWIGPVYPKGTRTGNMLELFSGMFDAIEINSTYYHPPKKDMFVRYPERTGGHIKVMVKLHGSFTHDRNAEISDAEIFNDAVKPIEDSGQFAGFLAQFPQSFHNSNDARGYVERLRDIFPDAALVFEFRHKSWWTSDTLKFLKDLAVSMCTVDLLRISSLPPTSATFTSAPAYVRLHGRNGADWYAGRDERYTYKYNRTELEEILEKVKKLILKSDDIFVMFNNHPHGNAPVNANEFVELLREIMPDALPQGRKERSDDSSQLGLF